MKVTNSRLCTLPVCCILHNLAQLPAPSSLMQSPTPPLSPARCGPAPPLCLSAPPPPRPALLAAPACNRNRVCSMSTRTRATAAAAEALPLPVASAPPPYYPAATAAATAAQPAPDLHGLLQEGADRLQGAAGGGQLPQAVDAGQMASAVGEVGARDGAAASSALTLTCTTLGPFVRL